jgi:hypothetical protein
VYTVNQRANIGGLCIERRAINRTAFALEWLQTVGSIVVDGYFISFFNEVTLTSPHKDILCSIFVTKQRNVFVIAIRFSSLESEW